MADLENTEKDTKKWDRERPFQRVASPCFKEETKLPVTDVAVDDKGNFHLNGLGHRRGTQRVDDFPALRIPGAGDLNTLIFDRGVRLAPAWVRTLGPPQNNQAAELAAEHELYGQVLRSFQTWTDAPGFQWHRWYDWNLHVQPVPEFDWVRGAGNRVSFPPPEKEKGEPSNLTQFIEGAIECEWDAGAFGSSRKPGPMFTDLDSGQTSSWIWPMSGDWVWVTGRSIYDGGHEFQQTEGATPLCRSELHPCKALATVRREAIQFPGTTHRIPATQFAFFASRRGGYVSFDTLAPPDGKDYEFLVDLPEMPDEFQALSHPVGGTPDFPFNRIVLRRPEPLVLIDFAPYANAAGTLPAGDLDANFKPDVKIEIPDPAKPRQQQARIRVPLAAVASKRPAAQAYGVVVSLGWPDPQKTQGKKVKRCEVQLKRIHPVSALEFRDEWRLKLCVNNRWFHIEREGIRDELNDGKPTDIPLMSQPLVFFLHEEDTIRVHAHGLELELMDNPFQGSDDARTVKFNRVQIFAEAIRTGQDPTKVLPGDTLADVASAIASLPLVVLEAIESVPVIGFVVQLLEGVLALLGISPTQLLGIAGERPADWKQHIDIQPPFDFKPAPGDRKGAHVLQRVIARNTLLMLANTFAQENRPIAICDPNRGFDDEKPNNPLPVAKNVDKPITITGVALKEDSLLAELFEFKRPSSAKDFDRKFVRFELDYTVKVTDQDLG